MSLVTFPNVFQLKINNTDHTSIAIVAILVVSWRLAGIKCIELAIPCMAK